MTCKHMTAIAVAVLLTSCTPTEVSFITDTTVGIDADMKLGRIAIAYDRLHGTLGPKFDSGVAPPVLASIRSNAKVINPQVSQLYATGSAAVLASANSDSKDPSIPETENLNFIAGANPKPMFFGTGSTVGVRLGFSNLQLGAMTLGIKLREVSVIPIQEFTNGTQKGYTYAPVLASIDIGAQTETPGEAAVAVGEFFATGRAAENLARNQNVRLRFRTEAERSIAQVFDAQDVASASVIRCYDAAATAYYPDIWQNAMRNVLLTQEEFEKLQTMRNDAKIVDDDTEAIRKMKLENGDSGASPYYRTRIALRAEDLSKGRPRVDRLRDHGTFVCGKVT